MKPKNLQQASQTRQIARLQERAEKTIDKFINSYINKVGDPDVSTEDLQKYLEWLDQRWRTFCHLQKFGPEAFTAFEDYIKKMYEQKAEVVESPVGETEGAPV